MLIQTTRGFGKKKMKIRLIHLLFFCLCKTGKPPLVYKNYKQEQISNNNEKLNIILKKNNNTKKQ